MKGLSFYKRDGRAFIQATMGLTLEEKGAYSLCLDLIYSNGGPIADDTRWIAGVCGVSVRKWTAIREVLIARGKLFAEDGKLMNERAVEEIAALNADRAEAVDNGAKGGRKRAENSAKSHETTAKPPREVRENDSGSNENNDLVQAIREDIDKTREDKKEEDSPPLRAVTVLPSKPNRRSVEPEGFAEFYATYPRKVSRADAAKAFAKALKRATLPVLVQGAIRYAQERAGEEPNYTKHPATWLNNDCWLDEPAKPKTFGGRHGSSDPTAQRRGASTAHQRGLEGLAMLVNEADGESKSLSGPEQPTLKFAANG